VISEAADAVDSVDTTAIFISTISERVDAVDTVIVSQTYPAIVLESAEATDAMIRRLLWENVNTSEQSDWVDIPTLN
jgi:DUF1009 family protein